MQNRITFVNSIYFGEDYRHEIIKYFDECMVLYNLTASYSNMKIQGVEKSPNEISFTIQFDNSDNVPDFVKSIQNRNPISLYNKLFDVSIFKGLNDLEIHITMIRVG